MAEEAITGADALQGLVDTSARLARMTYWLSEVRLLEASLASAYHELDKRRTEYLVSVSAAAREDPDTFHGVQISESTRQWIIEREEVIAERLAAARDVEASAGVPAESR